MHRSIIIIFLILFPIMLSAQSSDEDDTVIFKVYIDSTDAENPFVIRGHIINGPFPYPKAAWVDSLGNHTFRVILYFEKNCRVSGKVTFIDGNLSEEQINTMIRETSELIARKKIIFVANSYVQNCDEILSIWKEKTFEYKFGKKQ